MGRSRSNSPAATNYRGTYRVSKAKKPKKGKRRRRRKKGSNGDDDEGYGGGGGEGGIQVHNYDIEVSGHVESGAICYCDTFLILKKFYFPTKP